MSFADNFSRMISAKNLVSKEWSDFCDRLSSVSDTIRKMEAEGEALDVVVNDLNMGGVPASILEKLSNEKIASLIDSAVTSMREHGNGKSFVWGLTNDRGSLDLYVFNPVDGGVTSVAARLPVRGDAFPERMYLDVWIKKNVERYAQINNLVVLWDVTNFMCEIN